MKAMVYRKYGSPEQLQLIEVDKPVPKAYEVLVKVKNASVNSWDWDLITGKPLIYRLLFGILKPGFPIIGSDIAGTVEAVGSEVQYLKPGTEVFGDISGIGFGAFAEYVAVPENLLAVKSVKMTFEEAAAIPQAGVLALQGLRKGGIKTRRRVLINGAGGGVGTFAIQIARLWGAEVTAVDKYDKRDMLRSLGADYFIDYTKKDFTQTGQKYDLILDVLAERSVFDYRRALNSGGSLVIVGGAVFTLLQTGILGKWISGKNRSLSLLAHRPNKDDLEELKTMFDSGSVKPIIDKVYPLADLPQAIRMLGEGQIKGKVVIKMNG
ncbi:putative zinc-binding oxidoreductase [Fulvivirga imtechensis AK7]|uniref:Putative zinc-binding oxidoreductase n=1 Tax=Fulvivirga imtechensis AK7 TaxID=1237149 RepID=L8JUW5_9BACT|nr:NAD(P)-dependent alcohol dehydrogenase [Fulvivirga imtechensis]ELR72023.1 putative zinc-binding oxidoreductase [Fulvivirga imtechensis AK7]